MRKSKVLQKLRDDEIVSCTKINTTDGIATEIASILGFDCVWIDMEHIGQNWSAIKTNILGSKAHDTDIIVRVSKRGYNDYIKPLELDATGIMVPHIKTAKEAQEIIDIARFHPIGRRPLDGGNADGDYTILDFRNYLRQSNEEKFVILQIEDPEAIDEIGEIAALDGFDMLFFGPGDFSQGIGKPGNLNDPSVINARKKVAEVARRHGKFAGTVGSPDNYSSLVDMGYQFISLGADVVGLQLYFKDLLKTFKKEN